VRDLISILAEALTYPFSVGIVILVLGLIKIKSLFSLLETEVIVVVLLSCLIIFLFSTSFEIVVGSKVQYTTP
jgi:hypothetical protein